MMSILRQAVIRAQHVERPGHYSSELDVIPGVIHQRRVRAAVDRQWRETKERERQDILLKAASKYPSIPKRLFRAYRERPVIDEIRSIIRHVAHYYDFPAGLLLSPRRSEILIRPRHIAMYFAYELTGASYPEIGQLFGRDHTTVMHGSKKIARMIEEDEEFAAEINQLRDALDLMRAR